jgi:UDP-N-acetylmuramoylalanine--D-glutamate ligase
VTPDHLDRYESFEAYRDSKLRLFEMQQPSEPCHAAIIGEGVPAKKDGLHTLVPNVTLLFALDYAERQRHWPALQGPHNHQNAACAIAVAEVLGIPDDVIEQGLRTYPGLPHRMERVAQRGGVLFVNDSKATNPDSTAPALAAYPAIHWIVGGRAKTEDLGPCEAQLGHVRAAYTIGESGPMFFRLLEGKVPAVTQSGTLDRAVKDAAGAAKAGEVVLLSPACASFDQFRDYEHRGAMFREAVEALP